MPTPCETIGCGACPAPCPLKEMRAAFLKGSTKPDNVIEITKPVAKLFAPITVNSILRKEETGYSSRAKTEQVAVGASGTLDFNNPQLYRPAEQQSICKACNSTSGRNSNCTECSKAA